MKRFLVALVTLGLFHVIPAWADDLEGKHHKEEHENKGGGEKIKPAPTQKLHFKAASGMNHSRPGNKFAPGDQSKGFKGLKSEDPNDHGAGQKGDLSDGSQGHEGFKHKKEFRGDHGNQFGQDHGKDGGDDKNFKKGWEKTVRVSPELRKRGFQHLPEVIHDRKQFVLTDRQHSVIKYPTTDFHGRGIQGQCFKTADNTVVRNHFTNVTLNVSFNNEIRGYNAHETMSNHYYWHSGNGYNYCHYYDPSGYHWYGWYFGSNFLWTRYYSDRWWWYDNSFDRWCYWNNGGWWWQDPVRPSVVYIYNNDHYDRATADDSSQSDSSAPPSQGSTSLNVYKSKDQTRTVKIFGDQREAFLYDTGSQDPFKPMYLGSNVKEVKFSNTYSGKPLQIMLIFKDDTFASFDANGNPLQAQYN